jgi:hypothetical protein
MKTTDSIIDGNNINLLLEVINSEDTKMLSYAILTCNKITYRNTPVTKAPRYDFKLLILAYNVKISGGCKPSAAVLG